jgi:tetratricopeptide (TPR) repeat protein
MNGTRPSLNAFGMAVGLLVAGVAAAQPQLTMPRPSQRATVGQTIGLTEVTISYHRPNVNKRLIWGGLVPYGEVWRAGANENTTITFSTDVSVAGKPLPAGTYGLHMIPAAGEWTVIFSKTSWAWGSYGYDPREDALRVTVKPEPGEFQESLQYTFEKPTRNGVQAVLSWEKLRVPIPVEVDTNAVVLASIRKELRGIAQFSWQPWNQAAAFCLQNKSNVDEALTWADKSISMNENFVNTRVKAGLLELKGDKAASAALFEKSKTLATSENDVNNLGYVLLQQGKLDEAIEVFRKNVKGHPKSWNVWDSLAEAYAAKGDKKLAIENYGKALEMAPEDQKKRITGEIEKLKK